MFLVLQGYAEPTQASASAVQLCHSLPQNTITCWCSFMNVPKPPEFLKSGFQSPSLRESNSLLRLHLWEKLECELPSSWYQKTALLIFMYKEDLSSLSFLPCERRDETPGTRYSYFKGTNTHSFLTDTGMIQIRSKCSVGI